MAVRGGYTARGSPSLLCRMRSRKVVPRPFVMTDDSSCCVPTTYSTVEALKDGPRRTWSSAFLRAHDSCWHGRPKWSPSPVMWRIRPPSTWECQKPSGLRPEGCCHSIWVAFGVRRHGEWPNVSTCVPLLARGFKLFASLQVRALGLNAPEGTHHERHAVDGRPIGNRYTTACLGKIATNSQTYAT